MNYEILILNFLNVYLKMKKKLIIIEFSAHFLFCLWKKNTLKKLFTMEIHGNSIDYNMF
jgi:hypothetical protein